MKIFYDHASGFWYHTNVGISVTFGGDKNILPLKDTSITDSLSFNVNLENQHAGPIIGIMTARKREGIIAGNSALFIKLQKKLLSRGCISYIFTANDVQDDFINGYIFLPERNHWKKIKAPYPDLVYNRIPFRMVEQGEDCRAFFSLLKNKGIPFFNPCFLNKFELYCLLQNHPILKHYLPDTALISDLQTLYSFLEKYPCVYLKPSHSSKGKGVFRLSCIQESHLLLEGLKGSEIYPTFLNFWEKWEKVFIEKQYLVQENIISAKYDEKKFDLRILAHAKQDGYMVTGVGVRQAIEQDITTHVPHGGKLLPYEIFQSEKLDQFILLLVRLIGETLTLKYGFFGEFSIDAGISTNGDYYLYEVNSKPMSFDEIEIEEKKIERLCELFFVQSKFPYTNENQINAKE